MLKIIIKFELQPNPLALFSILLNSWLLYVTSAGHYS